MWKFDTKFTVKSWLGTNLANDLWNETIVKLEKESQLLWTVGQKNAFQLSCDQLITDERLLERQEIKILNLLLKESNENKDKISKWIYR